MIEERFLSKVGKYFPLEVDYYKAAHDAVNVANELQEAERKFNDKITDLLNNNRDYFLKPLSKNELLNLHLIITIVWDQRNYEEWHEKNRQYIKLRNKASKLFSNEKSRFEPENIEQYLIKKSVYRLFDFFKKENILNKENSYYFISQFLFESQGILNEPEAVKKMIQRRDNFH